MISVYVEPGLCKCNEESENGFDCKARDVCAPKALVCLDKFEPCFVDTTFCNGCGDCVNACKYDAIKIVEK